MASLTTPRNFRNEDSRNSANHQEEQSTTQARGGLPVIKIHERFAHIYFNPKARAATARQADKQPELVDYSKDKSVIVLDCGASTTVTGSLVNCQCTDVEVKTTMSETAKDGEGRKATHSCKKTYFVKNGLGDIVSITIYVRNLPHISELSGSNFV
jgi:hypothetical protein